VLGSASLVITPNRSFKVIFSPRIFVIVIGFHHKNTILELGAAFHSELKNWISILHPLLALVHAKYAITGLHDIV
jgi:hypothetical protein